MKAERAAPAPVSFGQSVTLAWSGSEVTACTASGSWSGGGSSGGSGSRASGRASSGGGAAPDLGSLLGLTLLIVGRSCLRWAGKAECLSEAGHGNPYLSERMNIDVCFYANEQHRGRQL